MKKIICFSVLRSASMQTVTFQTYNKKKTQVSIVMHFNKDDEGFDKFKEGEHYDIDLTIGEFTVNATEDQPGE